MYQSKRLLLQRILLAPVAQGSSSLSVVSIGFIDAFMNLRVNQGAVVVAQHCFIVWGLLSNNSLPYNSAYA